MQICRSENQTTRQVQLKALHPIRKAKRGIVINDQIRALRIVCTVPINCGTVCAKDLSRHQFTVNEQGSSINFHLNACAQGGLTHLSLRRDPTTRRFTRSHVLRRYDNCDVGLVQLCANGVIANQNRLIRTRDDQLIHIHRRPVDQQDLLIRAALHEHIARGHKGPSNRHRHIATQARFIVDQINGVSTRRRLNIYRQIRTPAVKRHKQIICRKRYAFNTFERNIAFCSDSKLRARLARSCRRAQDHGTRRLSQAHTHTTRRQ